ncbi:beta-1,3-galactosyltransferase 1-like [Planococcus citri]|uniref:beta-1,3-galactosyltransferase 1-like n=1 Tax=Planococcus citri TaxID=170843 RepID=UPI0031F8A25B
MVPFYIVLPMKSGIKWLCSTSKNSTKVFLLVFIVFLLLCYFPHFKSTPKTNEISGWEKSVNRNAKDYVYPEKLTTMTSVNFTCASNKPLMLIIVCSEIGHVEQRKAVRETWAVAAQRNNMAVLFLMGIDTKKEIDHEIIDENLKYGDIIVENFVDTYNNLTIKSIMMLKWINQNCLNAKFIMKVDDDVYINVRNVLKTIDSVKDADLAGFLLGKLYTHERPHRRLTSKWYMPKYMFADDLYPHYLCGVGYIMSSEVVRALYQESLKKELVYLEDLFITGICAKAAKLTPTDHLGFHFFEHAVTVECNSIHPHLVLLSHHLNDVQMRNQHEQMLECWRQILLPEWIHV